MSIPHPAESSLPSGVIPNVVAAPVGISEALRAATAYLYGEMPALLPDRAGQWAACQGTTIIGFAATKRELYDLCQQRGLSLADVAVAQVATCDPCYDPASLSAHKDDGQRSVVQEGVTVADLATNLE